MVTRAVKGRLAALLARTEVGVGGETGLRPEAEVFGQLLLHHPEAARLRPLGLLMETEAPTITTQWPFHVERQKGKKTGGKLRSVLNENPERLILPIKTLEPDAGSC